MNMRLRRLVGYVPLLASLVALLGVGERMMAAFFMTWKFGFEKPEPVHLVPQSFWLFAVVFGRLVVCTTLLYRFAERLGLEVTQSRLLRVSLPIQCCTGAFLMMMFAAGLAVLS